MAKHAYLFSLTASTAWRTRRLRLGRYSAQRGASQIAQESGGQTKEMFIEYCL
jgi:hypothetical protein